MPAGQLGIQDVFCATDEFATGGSYFSSGGGNVENEFKNDFGRGIDPDLIGSSGQPWLANSIR